ncbi:MAG: hydroxymethylglutaryl-CoA reductase, degradative [Flavobacteriales bacterium]|nr:hydroxymethylglutaryl-CoA reductase, degradative [Flavobacteriales bacterium]
MNKEIKGYSKLSKQAKIEWLIGNYFEDPEKAFKQISSYWHNEAEIQKLHDEFIENTITNFYLPYGVAPNFRINNEMYCLPMAIEESSVVAAASKAANFWKDRGGFKTKIISTTKIGHVHFIWNGYPENSYEEFTEFFDSIKQELILRTQHLTKNMVKRGGGIVSIDLVNKTELEDGYFQIEARFETCDSMGANFINSILEEFAAVLKSEIVHSDLKDKDVQVVMCILSNYTPECLVRAEVQCSVEELNTDSSVSPDEFADKFLRAIRIAEIEPYRAVTHNKGVMNGIDALVIATGNDFRAVEACVHAYAGRNGKYKSLTHASVEDQIFKFWIEVPLSLGTVGGITSLHPMVKFSNELLGKPNAEKLMQIIAAAGLAQNFSAIRSLVTTGIQKGHMKMHLLNILNQLEATEEEKVKIIEYFKDKVPSYSNTVEIFCKMRGIAAPSPVKKKNS